MADATRTPAPDRGHGRMVLSDGGLVWVMALARRARRVGEVCFNTAMTGYQEIMTIPYAADRSFTFPHIGNCRRQFRGHWGIIPGLGCIVRQEGHCAEQFSQ